jgi:uncharacterized protein (UPF0262 family)
MSTDRIAHFSIDDTNLPPASPEAEQERNIAIFDLLDGNSFRLVAEGGGAGPHTVILAPRDRHLVFVVTTANGGITEISLPFSAFRKRARAYFAICESYFEAVRRHSPDEIARLDEHRKTQHNEGADALRERLAESVEVDDHTARRLFTLVCSLSYRG